MAKSKSQKSKTNSATIGFEQQIWDAACELWGHIPAADYRKIFTGLIFLKYISTAFEKKYAELVAEGDGFEDARMLMRPKTSSLSLRKPAGQKLQRQPTHRKSAQS